MALTIKVTPAGRAAIRNAAGDGTNAIRIAAVGVTATAFTSGQPVPNEIKRIATIKGGATSADTIHVTVSDNGSDVYSVRGFAFYLADGTLFASYGQANVIVEKSAQAIMMLAIDVKFADIDATQITFGDTNFVNPAATNTTLGVVRLALEAEAIAGVDDQTAVTPKGLLAALNARLGNGAPSDFIKTLLTKPSVLAFCTALGIRSAAQYDTGAGNGLDADLLDNQHGSFYRAWANLTGVPAQFPPTLHSHLWSEISNPPATASRWPTWSEVTDKPGTYAPGPHTHAMADVTGLQTALDAKLSLTGGNLSGGINQWTGTVGKQVGIQGYGWSDNVTRWRTVMEADGKFALYSYDDKGNTAEQALAISSGSTGGRDFKFYGSTVWTTGNFDPATKAPIANPNFTGLVWGKVNNGTSGQWRFFPHGTTGVSLEAVTADASAYAPLNLGGSTVAINGQTVWHAGNFDPNSKANANSPTISGTTIFWRGNSDGDVVVLRGPGAGYNFYMQGKDLGFYDVNAGTFAWKWNSDARQFQINGAQAWHAANVTPLDKNVGGIMAAPIYFGDGIQGLISRGNGDNANFSTNNIAIKSWFGIGFGPTISGQPVAAGAYSHWFDVRTGNMGIAGNLNANGAIYANGGFQYSDREIKRNIRRRAVQRGIAIALAHAYSEWDRIADNVHDQGHVAQDLRDIAPQHVSRGPKRKHKPGLLVVDKAGAALEAALDNALHLEEHTQTLEAQQRLIAELLQRVEALENAA